MSLLQLAPIVAIGALVCVEAIVLARPPRNRFPRWFPLLLFAVAGLGLLFSISGLRGWLVVSSELGLLFVEGGAIAYASIVFLTLSSALTLGLLVSTVGRAVERPVSPLWSLLGSVAVAALAVSSIRTINPADSSELRIAVYDLWSPALVLWVSLSLVESALRACRGNRAALRLCAHAFVTVAIAWVAMERFEFLHPRTEMLWRGIGLAALVLSVGFLPVWSSLVLRPAGAQPRLPRLIATLTFISCTSLVIAWWRWPEYRSRVAWILCVGAAIVIAASIAWRLRRRDGPAASQSSLSTRQQLLMLFAHAIMAASLFSVQIFDSGLITLGLLAGWVILAESTGEGALARYLLSLRPATTAQDGSGPGLVPGPLAKARAHVATVFGRVLKTFSDSSIVGGVFKVLLAIVLVIGLSEIPNAGTTIIGSFSVDSNAKQKDLGQAVANHLVFELHHLNERLRPDVALVTAAYRGGKDRGFRFVAAKDDTTGLDSALAKQPDVDLGPLKVPLSVLAAPIKGPARQLFGVRVISGAVHEHSPHTTVLARSTTGDAWKVPLDLVANRAPASAKSSGTSPDTDAARDLAQRLALEIVTSDRSSHAAGLTRSVDALKSFQQGWSEWKRFDIDGDLTALATAISRFHEATTKDWHFALAHYRLARTLQKAGRPGAATEAFRASLQINEQFGPGLIGLASTLYDYDSYFSSPPAAVPTEPARQAADESLATLFRKHEASQLWQRVVRAPAINVSPIDRASAYTGLCLRAYDVGLSLDASASTLKDVRHTIETFDARAAFRAWTTLEQENTRISQLRAEGKAPRLRDLARQTALADSHREVFAPVYRAWAAATTALKKLDALGAEGARKALEPVNAMFAQLSTLSPTSEAEAEDLTRRTVQQLVTAEEQRQQQVPIQSRLTYFYCKRADRIYSSLADMRTDRDLRAGAARAAYLLGLTLERRHGPDPAYQKPQWSCMTQTSLPRGPYSRAALRHYNRAVVLAPEDAYIRCTAALTANAVDDPTWLRALERDSGARFNLADQHFVDARGASGRDAERIYRRAVEEYAAAIERNPNSVDALNNYAYTFWVWHYASLREAVPKPDSEIGERAHKHAERARQLAENKRPRAMEIMIRSTLGEVLLGLGRFEEAHTVLHAAHGHDLVKDHAVYNELRWDLAQACLCIARERTRSGRGGSPNEMKVRAAKLLAEIERIELGEEDRPFSTLVERSGKDDVCPTGGGGSARPKALTPAAAGRIAVR